MKSKLESALETVFWSLFMILPIVFMIVGMINEYPFVIFLFESPIHLYAFGLGSIIIIFCMMNLYHLNKMSNNLSGLYGK